MLNRPPDIHKSIARCVEIGRFIFADNINEPLFGARLIVVIVDVSGWTARSIRIIDPDRVIKDDDVLCSDLVFQQIR